MDSRFFHLFVTNTHGFKNYSRKRARSFQKETKNEKGALVVVDMFWNGSRILLVVSKYLEDTTSVHE